MQQLIFGLFGGTALLLLGIQMLGDGLEKAAGDAMKTILNKLTSSIWRGVGLGAFVTSIIQSSSATTVMVVGFVNAGMMTLTQALSIIYGANIGTTVTSHLLRLKIADYALPIIGIGVIMQMLSKNERRKNIGISILGFGLLFLGLDTLSSGSGYLSDNPGIKEAIQYYASNPFIAVLIGLILTGLIQSSTASTGLVVALAEVGLLSFPMAAGITLGNNIGTCVTAILASTGTSRAAKRAAWGHILFNVGGVVLFLPFFYPLIELISASSTDIKGQIANLHTIFNISTTLVFIPITAQFAKLLMRLVPDTEEEEAVGARHLDKLLLEMPDAAIGATYLELSRANLIAIDMYQSAYQATGHSDKELLQKISSSEDLINELQREVTRYMIEISKRSLSEAQAAVIPDLLHTIGDIERVGDHAFAMVEHVEKKINQGIEFSEPATLALTDVVEQLNKLSALAETSLEQRGGDFTRESKALTSSIAIIAETARDGHISRLERGECTVEAGVYYLDILSHFERIAEHFHNIVLSCAHRRSELLS